MQVYQTTDPSNYRSLSVVISQVNNFLRELFARWGTVEANHSITIIMFSRTYYPNEVLSSIPHVDKLPLDYDKGMRYQGLPQRIALTSTYC